MRGSGVGHVDFMLFVFISFALVSQCKLSFQWNMGFTKTLRNLNPLFHFYFLNINITFDGKDASFKLNINQFIHGKHSFRWKRIRISFLSHSFLLFVKKKANIFCLFTNFIF